MRFFDLKEIDMDILTIMGEIQKIGGGYSSDKTKKILYVADTGENTCRECSDNDGKIFDIDDPGLPQLPVHPNCRCKYVSATAPYEDVSEDVERHRIIKNLEAAGDLDEEKAKALAEQIVNARHENPKLREQKLFLLFNGRYLMSSDGKLLLDAVSGQPVSENIIVTQADERGKSSKIIEREFDYSYSRQGVKEKGGIPQGLYHIEEKEERSAKTSPLSHRARASSWGSYSWTMHPDKDTDIRKRTGFFVHGGAEFNTRGCIDLRRGDTAFQKYFVSTKLPLIYIYVSYEKERVKIQERK